MTAHHVVMRGNLNLYKRGDSRFWQCSTYLDGNNRRKSTKEESFERAKDIAEDWFLNLKENSASARQSARKRFAKRPSNFCANTKSSPRAGATPNMSRAMAAG